MKKIVFLILSLLLTAQISAHCGSCGMGGSEDDHSEGEEVEHHDKDAKFKANAKIKEEISEDEDPEDSEDADSENDY